MTIVITAVGLASGLALVLTLSLLSHRQQIREAKSIADDMISDAKDIMKERMDEAKSRADEHRELSLENFEKQTQGRNEKIEVKKSDLDEKKLVFDSRLDDIHSIFQKKQSLHARHKDALNKKRERLDTVKRRRTDIQEEIKSRLIEHSGANPEEITAELRQKIIEDSTVRCSKKSQRKIEEAQLHSEKNAKGILERVLNRFARPYCSERGISYVHMVDDKTRTRVFGPDNANLIALEKHCGVDLIHNQEMNSVSVSGFDPVRRELGRASLAKLVRERQINKSSVENIVAKTKKTLFHNIRRDGKKIAKELGAPDLHPEIQHRMGSLRYRYSFAQNQYFHCGEVGFLCGLLSAELGLTIKDGRRSGLLHDLGKSMDHSIDGGHAVIGADFIQKYDEKPHIVHAVRAHHYDETPSTDLAFLVIAADAISGARPGARRSTADSYMQKMNQLEVIGNSFDGVLDTYIMSAGREIRCVVDSKQVDDYRAMELTRTIAHKIEQEVSYPGLIKVTVVRRTEAIEVAR